MIARLLGAAAGLALAACTAAPAATPTPTPSVAPTASPGPTAAPTATATPTGTATPSPAPTVTLAPTQAPTGSPTAVPSASPGPTTAGGPAVECDVSSSGGAVTIVDFGYQPTDVAVSPGEGVTWTNSGDFPHTVTFDDGPDCGRLSGGQSVPVIFRQPGRYSYFCDIHPAMKGAVTVAP